MEPRDQSSAKTSNPLMVGLTQSGAKPASGYKGVAGAKAPRALSKANFRRVSAPAVTVRAGLLKGAPHQQLKERPLADRVGIWLSFLCMIHCLLTPVLLLLFPALQAMSVTRLHEGFHLALLLILPVVAVLAFIPGFRRHGDRSVFYWSIPGLIIIAFVALFFEDASWVATGVSVTGSLLLIRAHSVNRRLCACCVAPTSGATLS